MRRQGFSIDRGNYIAGVTIVAVPVLNGQGTISHTLASVGLSEPARPRDVGGAGARHADRRRPADIEFFRWGRATPVARHASSGPRASRSLMRMSEQRRSAVPEEQEKTRPQGTAAARSNAGRELSRR